MSTPTDESAGFDGAQSTGEAVPAYAPGEFPSRPTDEPAPGVPQQQPAEPRPDEPVWGVFEAVAAVVVSFVLMLVFQIIVLVPYVLAYGVSDPQRAAQEVLTNKTVILLSVLSTIPAHLATLALCWAIVTRFGKRPFWRSLGWHWSPRFGRLEAFGLFWLAIAMIAVGYAFSYAFGERETEFLRLLSSSRGVRYAVAAMAVFTAPLVEEVLYRGLVYSALRRRLGVVASVLAVLALFAGIHFWQYWGSVAALLTITVLSLVLTAIRAYTGRLLPCFILHLIFNGLQAVVIVTSSQFDKAAPPPAPPPVPPTGAIFDALPPLSTLLSLPRELLAALSLILG